MAKLEAAVVEGVAAEADFIIFPELITFDTWRVDEVESHAVPSQQELDETRRIAAEITPLFLTGMAALAKRFQVDIWPARLRTSTVARFLIHQFVLSRWQQFSARQALSHSLGVEGWHFSRKRTENL